MIRFCSVCSNMSEEDLREALLGKDVEIEDGCIGECGNGFSAYINEEFISASNENEFIEQVKEQL